MQKEVGIITTSNAINYGAVLQAYALKEAISEQGLKVEIINYSGNIGKMGRKIFRSNSNIKNIIYNSTILMNKRYRKRRHDLICIFDEFKSNELKVFGKVLCDKNSIESVLQYDILIIGSDQLWNLNLMDDDIYFLPFYQKYPHIVYCAYAISIAEEMSESQIRSIQERTRHFKRISIREKKTADYLKKVLDREIENTIDPVFLLSREKWSKIVGKRMNLPKDYIFVFLIGRHHQDKDMVNYFHRKTGKKVVVLNLHPIEYISADKIFHVVEPFGFIELIREASLIVTDSFHATAFSIIFNKEFYTIQRANRNIRITNLYEILEIKDRFVKQDNYQDTLSMVTIQYDNVNRRIQNEREKSIQYLREILEVSSDKN